MADAAEYKKVEVGRKDNFVILTVRCADDSAAMLLYDQIAAELTAGFVELSFETRP